jgi:hypothetical protein
VNKGDVLWVSYEICRGIERSTRMLGYADDWVVVTSNKTPKTAEARLQKATNMVFIKSLAE